MYGCFGGEHLHHKIIAGLSFETQKVGRSKSPSEIENLIQVP